MLERAVILASDGTVTPDDLPTELGVESGAAGPISAPASFPGGNVTALQPLTDDACNFERATLGFQRQHIARVLDRAGGSGTHLYMARLFQKVGLKGYQVEATDVA